MVYRNTRQVVEDLQKHGMLQVVEEPFSAKLEIAEIQRRVFARGGPALFFPNPRDSSFPMVGNLFGTMERARFLFRHTLESVTRAIELKIDPSRLAKKPWRYYSAPWVAWRMLPKSVRSAAVMKNQANIEKLPQLISWPMDGGPFVTLPQVLSQSSQSKSLTDCNLGMYRIQLSGNQYQVNGEMGLHYQIHRGIGVHHQEAIEQKRPFYVNVFVGGSPAMTFSAVMPLPEGLSELTFAGALAGHRIPMLSGDQHAPIYADADFCIVGEVDPNRLLPEGPFGDHLGYYSLVHDFPVLKVHKIYHRDGAIWPFTVVGRPPQEDTIFGELIHEITGDIIPTVIPGVRSVHAVDASGVHPLLLAIGSERYTPYRKPDRPQELLTQANAILGQGQMSLAKYLWILDEACAPSLSIHDISSFMQCCLERIDFQRDLHFQTRTTIDTLDYSGEGWNSGSKLVIAASGPPKRTLCLEVPALPSLPSGWGQAKLCLPGVLAVEGPKTTELNRQLMQQHRQQLVDHWQGHPSLNGIALVVLVDDSEFTAQSLQNYLWVTFTRSNPATDVFGFDESIVDKHWQCAGPIAIDARRKPHHAPPLLEDPNVTKRIDAWAAKGGPLARYL